jgi:hypothetical protein
VLERSPPPTPFQPLNLKHKQKTFRYPNPELKAANGSNQRRQTSWNSVPTTLDRPLHLNCWAGCATHSLDFRELQNFHY